MHGACGSCEKARGGARTGERRVRALEVGAMTTTASAYGGGVRPVSLAAAQLERREQTEQSDPGRDVQAE
jgi:hypothetical protein